MGFHDSLGGYHAFRKAIAISLNDFREATTGDVGAIAANGGILASDTTPTLTGVSTGITQRLTWAASNVDQILCQFSVPEDFDGREDVLVELWVSSGGTTDLSSFGVATAWDGGASVSDTATDTAASVTVHKITARIAAADIPDSPSFFSMTLIPAAHTTDTMLLDAVRMTYVARNN
jgi:hypothetical protein